MCVFFAKYHKRISLSLALILGVGTAPFAAANPGPIVMPPPDWDPEARLNLGELITTIQAADGVLEAHKGAITALANGSYSVNINYVLDGAVYRVSCIVNADGTGSTNAAGQALYSAIAQRPSLNQLIIQNKNTLLQSLPTGLPKSGDQLPAIFGLSDCAEAWIGLAVAIVQQSWIGGLWALYKVISKCF